MHHPNQIKSKRRSIVASNERFPYLCRRGPIPFHFLRVIRPTRRARRARHLPTTARHVSSSKDLLHHRHIRRRRRRRRRRHHSRREFTRRDSLFKTFDGVSCDDACDRSRRSSEHARLSAGPFRSATKTKKKPKTNKQCIWRENSILKRFSGS
jgi:hypothetical protein